MLNWETYKTLNSEQKEEYNFRFKDREIMDVKGLANNVLIFIMSIIILTFIIYLSITSPSLQQYKIQINTLLNSCLISTLIITMIIMGYCIEYVVRSIIQFIQFYKWKKQNNIKQIYWWKNGNKNK